MTKEEFGKAVDALLAENKEAISPFLQKILEAVKDAVKAAIKETKEYENALLFMRTAISDSATLFTAAKEVFGKSAEDKFEGTTEQQAMRRFADYIGSLAKEGTHDPLTHDCQFLTAINFLLSGFNNVEDPALVADYKKVVQGVSTKNIKRWRPAEEATEDKTELPDEN